MHSGVLDGLLRLFVQKPSISGVSLTANPALTAALQSYFIALHECDERAFRKMWHPSGLLLGIGPDGGVLESDFANFCASTVARGRSPPEYRTHDKVVSLHMLDSKCANAKVEIALLPASDSSMSATEPTLYTVFLTLL